MTTASIVELPEMWMELRDPGLLRRQIEDKGFTLREFSAEVGWKSHGYLNRLLKGEAKTLKTDPALRMAYLLGLPADVLFVTRVSGDTAQVEQSKRTTRVQTGRRRRGAAA